MPATVLRTVFRNLCWKNYNNFGSNIEAESFTDILVRDEEGRTNSDVQRVEFLRYCYLGACVSSACIYIASLYGRTTKEDAPWFSPSSLLFFEELPGWADERLVLLHLRTTTEAGVKRLKEAKIQQLINALPPFLVVLRAPKAYHLSELSQALIAISPSFYTNVDILKRALQIT